MKFRPSDNLLIKRKLQSIKFGSNQFQYKSMIISGTKIRYQEYMPDNIWNNVPNNIRNISNGIRNTKLERNVVPTTAHKNVPIISLLLGTLFLLVIPVILIVEVIEERKRNLFDSEMYFLFICNKLFLSFLLFTVDLLN